MALPAHHMRKQVNSAFRRRTKVLLKRNEVVDPTNLIAPVLARFMTTDQASSRAKRDLKRG